MASFRTRPGNRIQCRVRVKVKGKELKDTLTLPASQKRELEEWAVLRAKELREKGEAALKPKGSISITEALQMYLDMFGPPADKIKSGGKFGHIRMLINKQPMLAKIDAIHMTSAELIAFGNYRATNGNLRKGGELNRKSVDADFSYMRIALKAVRAAKNIPINLDAFPGAVDILRAEKKMGASRKRDRRPTLEELNTLLPYFAEKDKRSNIKIPMVELILFAIFSGRRIDEICRILWSDLDHKNRKVLVRDMKDPREKIDVWCNLTPEAYEIIKRQPKTSDRIFPYNSQTVGFKFNEACKKHEFTGLVFHCLRHEFISWSFEQQLSVPVVSKMSGHRSWKNLQRYTHLSENGYFDKYENWEYRPKTEKAVQNNSVLLTVEEFQKLIDKKLNGNPDAVQLTAQEYQALINIKQA